MKQAGQGMAGLGIKTMDAQPVAHLSFARA